MTATKTPSPWLSLILTLALALFSLVAWGTSGNYASSEAVSDIRVEVKGHNVQIQAHERTLETMARQIDDRAIGNINRR